MTAPLLASRWPWLRSAPATSAVAPPRATPATRIAAVDFARGLAVCLMILSHGVNGLLAFEQFGDAGMFVHALTKFASSLFFVVFGIALAVAFVPHADADDWPRRRLKLLLTGLTVLFWYKLLTIVELAGVRSVEEVRAALLYRDFPSYVEILGFYALMLLWLPWLLPLWKRLPVAVRWASPLLAALLAWAVTRFVAFDSAPLQALLVEHEDYYTWGQLSRLPLVLLGLLLGDLLRRGHDDPAARRRIAATLGAASAALFAVFALLVGGGWSAELDAIARNVGKHPPELRFMLFSLGGALGLLALAISGGDALARALRPVTLIGGAALKAFVFHIVVIFAGLRWLLGYVETLSYAQALTLTLGVIAATAAWIAATRWVHARTCPLRRVPA